MGTRGVPAAPSTPSPIGVPLAVLHPGAAAAPAQAVRRGSAVQTLPVKIAGGKGQPRREQRWWWGDGGDGGSEMDPVHSYRAAQPHPVAPVVEVPHFVTVDGG